MTAPKAPGRYALELDVVHEGVRWFGCVTRVGLEVLPDSRHEAARRRWTSVPKRLRQRAS